MSISDRIERAARVIAEHVGFLGDLDSDPQVVEHVTLHPVALARALDQAGALAPGPLIEEWRPRNPVRKPSYQFRISAEAAEDWDDIDRSEGGGKAATGG